MVLSIRELWNSSDEKEWRGALASYWDMPTVRRVLEIEQLFQELDPERVRELDTQGWREFLVMFFRWKFTGTYLGRRLADLEKNKPEHLSEVKGLLFAFDLSNVRKGIERAQYIKGLGPAGASGLLAVLFPKWFGTVDRFVVSALVEVENLPEKRMLLGMRPDSLTDDDAVTLINILRKKATHLNELFHTGEWTPRKIDMILWSLRNGRGCS